MTVAKEVVEKMTYKLANNNNNFTINVLARFVSTQITKKKIHISLLV